MKKPVEWVGEPPAHCDLCRQEIGNDFVDGATTLGGWALMCKSCHQYRGFGFGMGKGQLYMKDKSGRWFKIAG